jgi:ribonuclease T2
MPSHRVRRAALSATIAFSFVFIFAIVALAQDPRQNAPGAFDFYVLALSWSPSFCESAKERAPNGRPDPQCNGRPFTFIVHGLSPEYEQGFPSYCQVPAQRLDRQWRPTVRPGERDDSAWTPLTLTRDLCDPRVEQIGN